MSKVFSMDSEGIWKACTAKVMTKTAITTVTSRDCTDPAQSDTAAVDRTGRPALVAATLAGWSGVPGGIPAEAGSGDESGTPVPSPAVRMGFSAWIFPPSPFGLTINTREPGEPRLAQQPSWWARRRGQRTPASRPSRARADGLLP